MRPLFCSDELPTFAVTEHPCIKKGFLLVLSTAVIIQRYNQVCYPARECPITQSLLYLSYHSKHFSFLFPAKSTLKSKKEEISPLGSTLAKRPSGPLEVGTPFYQDGQLQVRVYWKKRGGRSSVFSVFVPSELAPRHGHQSL